MDEVKLLPCEELVERVAIECHHASCANVPRHNPDYDRTSYPWKHCPTPAKDAWRAIARAAIEATRPTLVTDELVERVARAICRAHMLDDGYSQETADRAADGDMWKNFQAEARASIAAMPTLVTGQLEGEGHVKAAYRETLKRYPGAVKALAFFWSASGLGAGEVTAEHIEWAKSVLAHPQPGPSQ